MNQSEKNIFHNKRGIPWNRASLAKVKPLTRRSRQLRIYKTQDVVLVSIAFG